MGVFLEPLDTFWVKLAVHSPVPDNDLSSSMATSVARVLLLASTNDGDDDAVTSSVVRTGFLR